MHERIPAHSQHIGVPPDLYDCYVRFAEESTASLIALMSTQGQKDHLRATQKPLPRTVFEERVRTMDPGKRLRYEAMMRLGYEQYKASLEVQMKATQLKDKIVAIHTRNIFRMAMEEDSEE